MAKIGSPTGSGILKYCAHAANNHTVAIAAAVEVEHSSIFIAASGDTTATARFSRRLNLRMLCLRHAMQEQSSTQTPAAEAYSFEGSSNFSKL
mmetsp:Transcript_38172/g.89544  ORF Transcript_38172/g.89544 Transcript_38172/m.89544 type:complete len:93 (+) Transcript_38172:1081-1359(+)